MVFGRKSRYIVRKPEALVSALESFDVKIQSRQNIAGYVIIESSPKIADELTKAGWEVYPDIIVSLVDLSNSPPINPPEYLTTYETTQNMGLHEYWELGYRGQGIKICILDIFISTCKVNSSRHGSH